MYLPQCKGVHPKISLTFTEAPCDNKTSAIPLWPAEEPINEKKNSLSIKMI
jgi:hypothetical protein